MWCWTAVLNWTLSSIDLMLFGRAFQSISVLGINEFFRQFLLQDIWVYSVWRDARWTGRRVACSGIAGCHCNAWWKMDKRVYFLLSCSSSHSRSCFIFVTALYCRFVCSVQLLISVCVLLWAVSHGPKGLRLTAPDSKHYHSIVLTAATIKHSCAIRVQWPSKDPLFSMWFI